MALYRYSPRIIVKVPATHENYLTTRQLTDAGVRVMANEGFDGKLLAAGIRSVDQFNQIALQGCDAITLPARIFNELISTPSAVKKVLQEFPASDLFLTSLTP